MIQLHGSRVGHSKFTGYSHPWHRMEGYRPCGCQTQTTRPIDNGGQDRLVPCAKGITKICTGGEVLDVPGESQYGGRGNSYSIIKKRAHSCDWDIGRYGTGRKDATSKGRAPALEKLAIRAICTIGVTSTLTGGYSALTSSLTQRWKRGRIRPATGADRLILAHRYR